jgi:hypothetical protein
MNNSSILASHGCHNFFTYEIFGWVKASVASGSFSATRHAMGRGAFALRAADGASYRSALLPEYPDGGSWAEDQPSNQPQGMRN